MVGLKALVNLFLMKVGSIRPIKAGAPYGKGELKKNHVTYKGDLVNGKYQESKN